MGNSMNPEMQGMLMAILLFSGLFALINYIVTGFAIYSVSKRENLKKPWLGWVPIGNFYQLIKLGGGKQIFIIAMVGVILFGKSQSFPLMLLGMISSLIYSFYSMKMYYYICDKYDVNFIFIAISLAAPLCIFVKGLGNFLIPVLLVGLYGQYKLIKAAKAPVNKNGRIIETRVVSSKRK